MTYPWPYSLPPHIHPQPQPTQPHWIQFPPQASPQPFSTLPPTPPQHPTSHHYPMPITPPLTLNTSNHINFRHIFQCNLRLPSTLPNLRNNIHISQLIHHNPKLTHILHCHFSLNLNLNHHLINYINHIYHIYHINYLHHRTRQIKPLPQHLFNHHHYKHLMYYKHHHLIQQQSLHSS